MRVLKSVLFASEVDTMAEDTTIRRRKREEMPLRAPDPLVELKELVKQMQKENKQQRTTTRILKGLVYLLIIVNVCMVAEIVVSIFFN
jgi:hypothetical protein